MRTLTIAAGEVLAGDRIYNRGAYHPSAAWVTVTETHRTDTGSVRLITGLWETWKHPLEGMAVQREEE